MDSDQSEMASIQPNDLPSLMNASQAGGMSGRSMSDGENGMGALGAMRPPNLGSSPNSPLGSIGSMLGNQNQASGFPQQARLENQRRFPLQQYSFPKPAQQPMLRHRPNPYADVPSLYDLVRAVFQAFTEARTLRRGCFP